MSDTELERLRKAERHASDRVVGYARGIARALREKEDIGFLAKELFLEAVESQREAQEALMRALSEKIRTRP